MRSRAGTTILEAVVSFALLATIMVVGSSAFSSYRRVLDNSSALDLKLQSLQMSLRSMRSDLRASFQVLQPLDSNVASELQLLVRNRAYSIPANPALSWEPTDSARVSQVTYRMVNGSLIREDLSTSTSTIIAYDLEGLSVENADGLLRVSLSFQNRGRLTRVGGTLWGPSLTP